MYNLLSLYNILPYSLKVAAASIWGLHLSHTRYSRDIDTIVEQALARESWNADLWKNWQENQLSFILHKAATNIPYYCDQWEKRRRKGDHASLEYLENWPVLHKEELRSASTAFISSDANRKRLISDYTSGTTGVPLTLWFSKEAMHTWYALFEARWRKWYGLSRHDRWGMLGGQLITPFSRSKPPFWVWNAGMNQLYLSTFHISPQYIPSYIDAIRRYELIYLLGYASSLYDVARFALEQDLSIPHLKVVLSNAEPLYDYQRTMIAQAFHCPVIDTYGQAEKVCAASECSAGKKHLWPEVGITEVFSFSADQPAALGETGRLICTGLLNDMMPLIRYEVGDYGQLSTGDERCACDRSLPFIGEIEGRTEDMIVTRDGRRIEGPDTVFQAAWPIRETQIIQETLDRIRVCIIPAPGFDKNIERLLISGLHDRVGDMEIIIDKVANIPRSKSGKRKVIVSHVDKHN